MITDVLYSYRFVVKGNTLLLIVVHTWFNDHNTLWESNHFKYCGNDSKCDFKISEIHVECKHLMYKGNF